MTNDKCQMTNGKFLLLHLTQQLLIEFGIYVREQTALGHRGFAVADFQHVIDLNNDRYWVAKAKEQLQALGTK